MPDVLVNGANWPLEAIAGRVEVESTGAKVVVTPLAEAYSTGGLIAKIRSPCKFDLDKRTYEVYLTVLRNFGHEPQDRLPA